MRAAGVLSRVRGSARRFAPASGGNVAVIFAIALVPMIGFIGAAVDYTRANTARSAMQAALDSTALMLSKDLSDNLITSSDVQTKAVAYFNGLYHNTDAPAVTLTASYTANGSSGSSVTINGASSVATDFMKVVGFPNIPITSSSTTVWGNTRMRVAMVLDNTGSMADNGKMSALQSAATNMITTLSGYNQQSGDVYISIVPFAKDVSIGSSNVSASWLKWNGTSDSWEANNGSCNLGSSYSTQSSCTGSGSCSSRRYTSQSSCQSRGYTWTTGVWTPDNHNTWNGCLMDRDQDYDISNAAPITGDNNTPSTRFYPEQYNACPTSIMSMSNSWSTLKSKISAMSPNGGTNQAIGIAWGWQSLSTTNGPIQAPAKDSNYVYKDYLVVLSDGLNTQDRWPSYGNGNTQYSCSGSPCIDARQETLCQSIKASGVTIFTVQVNVGNKDPKSQVLQDCASGTDNFQMITSASQTADAFDNILTQISKLRVAK